MPYPGLSRKVCNIDQLLEPRSGYSALSFNNRTRPWVSDCTSFDPHDRFTLRLDSTSGSGLFFADDTRPVHSPCQLAKYRDIAHWPGRDCGQISMSEIAVLNSYSGNVQPVVIECGLAWKPVLCTTVCYAANGYRAEVGVWDWQPCVDIEPSGIGRTMLIRFLGHLRGSRQHSIASRHTAQIK
jgi:hypothetical protein